MHTGLFVKRKYILKMLNDTVLEKESLEKVLRYVRMDSRVFICQEEVYCEDAECDKRKESRVLRVRTRQESEAK